MIKNPAFLIHTDTCIGCKTCMIACKDKHDTPIDVNWRRVAEYVGGEWIEHEDNTYTQNVFAYYVSVSCNHCEDPICVKACPTGAMHKNLENGIVSVDATRCVGCRYCEWNCPYSAPQFNKQEKHMTKCDFCEDYLQNDVDPACVAACPNRCIEFGERDELLKKYQQGNIAPLPAPSITNPSLFVVPHRNAKPVDSTEGYINNEKEM